jgi:hypothetical protein
MCKNFVGSAKVFRLHNYPAKRCSRSASLQMFIIMFLSHGWWPALYVGLCLKYSPPLTISGSNYSCNDCPFWSWGFSPLSLRSFVAAVNVTSLTLASEGPQPKSHLWHTVLSRKIWGWEAVTTCRCGRNILMQVQRSKEMRVVAVGIRTADPPTGMSTNVAHSRSDFLQSVMWNTRFSDSKSGTNST